MVEFSFDATQHEPWQGAEHDTPMEYALRLWTQFELADSDLNLFIACDLARDDRDTWDAVQTWAWSQDIAALPFEAQAAVGRALGRKPPRQGKGATEKRNTRLRAVAARVSAAFPKLGLTRDKLHIRNPKKPTNSISYLLAQLPGVEIGESKIMDEITKKPSSKSPPK